MLRSFFLPGLLLAGAIPAMAEVNPQHHQLCKEAKDYAGCIRAMTTDVTQPVVTKIDQTNRPGLQQEMGNSCPAGYGYSGAGQCRSVMCQYQGIFGKNEPQLAGKGHTCEGRNRQMGLLTGRATLVWGGNYMRAINDPNCPQTEPSIGGRSSCSRSTLLPNLGRSKQHTDWER